MSLAIQIKDKAAELGFDACGICKAEFAEKHAAYLKKWLDEGKNAGMQYMHNHFEKRTDPSLLSENARSLVMVALNYYPAVRRNPSFPQISYYAYGKDYHQVIKNKLKELLSYIRTLTNEVQGRMFCDSAPLLEKYHAQKAGIGWIGKNTQLIIPGKGSFFFLGALLLNIDLPSDTPVENQCGNCTKCLEACPTRALESPFRLNAGKCLSYLTIENKGEIPSDCKDCANFPVYGCDICNLACPWNIHATPTQEEAFLPNKDFLDLDASKLEQLSESDFLQIFRYSPVFRLGYEGLMRNVFSARDAAGRHAR